MDTLTLLRVVAIVGTLAVGLRAAGGRLAPKMALAPLFFLVTRLPVLLTWAVGAAGMYALMSAGAAANGKTPDPMFMLGISVFCGLGFAALAVGPAFMVVRAFSAKPTFTLEDHETIVDTFVA